MKTLVVCYSLTGNTEAVGRALAERLGADFELIVDARKPTGLRAMWTMLRSLVSRYARDIAPSVHAPEDYDLVAIGSPVWGWSVTPFTRAYLRRHREALHDVAFFCTEGGTGDVRAFRQMAAEARAAPAATLAVKEKDIKEGRVDDMVAAFAEELLARPPQALTG